MSASELITGEYVINKNVACNMLRSKFYVCPVCGNILYSCGEAMISCCGITLTPLEPEKSDGEHRAYVEKSDDEYFVSVNHCMSKEHYISFIAFVHCNGIDLVKIYPEGDGQARFQFRSSGTLYIYCNKHGLFTQKIELNRI